MNEELNIEFEKEGDMTKDWITNTVLIRNSNGELIEVNVPDDEEE